MGWSVAQTISKKADHYDDGNYSPVWYIDGGKIKEANWFFQGWWTNNEWAWIYINDTDMPVRVSSLTFLACAGHSNGQQFCGGFNPDGSPALVGPADGTGCTFTSDIYVVGPNGEQLGDQQEVSEVIVPSIVDFNCYANGKYGHTNTQTQLTSFGSRDLFGPNSGDYYKDTRGTVRCREPRTIHYKDAPVIPVGGKMFVTIRVMRWNKETWNALLVMQGSGSNFSSVIEPVDESYVWVRGKNDAGQPMWRKEKKSFLRTSKGWEEM